MSPARLQLTARRREALEVARQRLMIGIVVFVALFTVLAGRTLELGLLQPVREARTFDDGALTYTAARADIVDRNGVVLATNLPAWSLYAEPHRVMDPAGAAQKLAAVLPDVSADVLEERLSSSRNFVWLKRKLTPQQRWQVNALGLPGVDFRAEEERVYPYGPLAAHTLGFVDVDGNGLAGIEHFFNDRLTDPGRLDQPLRMSIDIRVQHALTDEVRRAVETFDAVGGVGVVMDVTSGELIAMASLPDFDPNVGGSAAPEARFNRATKGVYELGSTFKVFTLAMALENNTVSFTDGYDASEPIRISRFLIRDDHPQKRWLSVPEIFAYSSNIGAAKMALDVGTEAQRSFLGRLGLLRPASLELTEVGYPLVPENWRETATMTISYGHGIAVSPLQLSTAIAAISNGGLLKPATLLANDAASGPGERVISEETSEKMRKLMRLGVLRGTGSQADAPGFRVGGKTGTAEKAGVKGYERKALLSSFAGVFPIDDPKYLVYVMLDEPQGTEETWGYAGGGWVAAPVVRNVVTRAAPLLDVAPAIENVRPYEFAATLIAARED